MNDKNKEEFLYDHYKNLVNRQELNELITLCNRIRKIVLDIEWMANFGVGFRNYNLDVDLNEIDNYVIQADFPREDFLGTPFEDVESKDFLHKMYCTKEQLFSKVNKFLKE